MNAHKLNLQIRSIYYLKNNHFANLIVYLKSAFNSYSKIFNVEEAHLV